MEWDPPDRSFCLSVAHRSQVFSLDNLVVSSNYTDKNSWECRWQFPNGYLLFFFLQTYIFPEQFCHRFSDFICELVHLSLMNRVRHPSVPGFARTSSDGTRCAITILERYESDSCRSGSGRRGGVRNKKEFQIQTQEEDDLCFSPSCCVKRASLPRPLMKQSKN